MSIHRVLSRLLQDMSLFEIACSTPLFCHQDMEEVLHSRLEMTANCGKQEDVGCLLATLLQQGCKCRSACMELRDVGSLAEQQLRPNPFQT